MRKVLLAIAVIICFSGSVIAESELERQKNGVLKNIKSAEEKTCSKINEDTIYKIYLARLCTDRLGEIKSDVLDTRENGAEDHLIELWEELNKVVEEYSKYISK
ncbi:MAG: hypothetical protein Q8R36_01575 [bacterium]|nr:hypothetical protein [bacterium]